MPYIRACKSLAKQTSRGAEDMQGSQVQAKELTTEIAESKARGHTYQELGYRQQARGLNRG